MTIELITAATPEIHEAMGRLIPQLSRSAAPMSEADVEIPLPVRRAPLRVPPRCS